MGGETVEIYRVQEMVLEPQPGLKIAVRAMPMGPQTWAIDQIHVQRQGKDKQWQPVFHGSVSDLQALSMDLQAVLAALDQLTF